jgi:Cytochrome c7 and related cytochrome c
MLALPTLAAGQISPGPLARAHHDLEGPTNCAQCHGLHREPMDQMCLACHKEIGWLLDHHQGYHARVVTVEKKECSSCHPDHAGQHFDLIAWPGGARDRFDHRLAGWVLEGKHAEATCEDCHTLKFRVGPAAALSKRTGSPGWVGLETDCVSCHRADDVHKGALGQSCDRCHDSKGWKPAPKFDHDSSAFPLTGKHVDVACDKCHLAPSLGITPDAKGKLIPRFKPLAFKVCTDCHANPHGTTMAGRCVDCHTTRGWKAIEQTHFNHAATRYPLLGKHATVACDRCHGPNLKIKDPPFATCTGCHQDPHAGQAVVEREPADCAACHTVQGFTPSTFTVAQHASTGYPLTGKHATVKCAACHTTTGKVTRLAMAFAKCADCHADQHGGQLASRPGQGSCEACHTDAGWTPSTFSLAAHAKLRLALDGRHAKIACAACHGVDRTGLPPLPKRAAAYGPARVVLQVPETECQQCHVDPHGGRFATGGASPMTGGCRACHTTTDFRPSTVDVDAHARFSFALDGAHRATPCVACHAEMRAVPAASTLIAAARGVPKLPFDQRRATDCRSCHEKDTPHGTQFAARKDGGACGSCHDAASFTPASRFDHDRDAAFPLAGAHAKVPCASCHKTQSGANGKPFVVYRPVSTACASCHGGTTPRRSP